MTFRNPPNRPEDIGLTGTPADVGIVAVSQALAFDVNGEATLTHNLGRVPTAVSLIHDAAGIIIDLAIKSATLTTTTVVVVARTNAGAIYSSGLNVRAIVA